jgi:hypothetical protein
VSAGPIEPACPVSSADFLTLLFAHGVSMPPHLNDRLSRENDERRLIYGAWRVRHQTARPSSPRTT